MKLRGWEFWALAAIVCAGALLRAWLEVRWRPGFLGFPDTNAYIGSTQIRFEDVARPPGYPLLLELLWSVWRDLELVIVLQHLLGLLSTALAYLLARALGAPPWAGLIPAAVVALGGAQILLEHSFLSEAPFAFLVLAAFTAVAFGAGDRAPRDRRRYAWITLAGLLLGLATLMRTYVIVLIVPLGLYVLLADRRPRHAFAAVSALVLTCVLVLTTAMSWHGAVTGRFALTEAQFYNYYGRVATFADCNEFEPPRGSRGLCPTIPRSQREGPRYWDFESESPLQKNFDAGYGVHPSAELKRAVRNFALAAVINQPGDYAATLARDSWRLFVPRFPLNPNRAIGNIGAGPGPVKLRAELVNAQWSATALTKFLGYDGGQYGHRGSLDGFYAYESVARISDVRMAILLLLALLAPFVAAPGATRRGALLVLGSALIMLMLPIFVNMYSYRYVVPVLPLLAVAAALGASGLRDVVVACRRVVPVQPARREVGE